MNLIINVIFIFAFANYVESVNILYIVPFTSKSHHILLKPIGLELARRGHNVTVITGHLDPKPPPNYRQVLIDKKEIWDVIGGERPNVFDMVEISTEEFHKKVLWGGGLSFTESILNSTEVRKLLAEDVKFDLIINEQFFQEATNVLAYKYDAPLVLVTTFGNCMRHNILTRNPLQLATVISEFLDVKVPTSFWARLRNLYFTVYEYVYWRYVYLNQQEALVKKYIPDLRQPVPSLYELQKNVSLMLVNGHFSFDIPVAYLPNVVEIGGIHLTKSETMLPDDLQKVLDNAKSGVIYMNFGSNVRSSELPNEKRDAFLNVFRKLNQTILWKWEDDTLNLIINVIFIFAFANYVESVNILYIVPFTSKSHHILLKPIGLELARRGHNVTVITGHLDPKPPPNYRQVLIDKKEIWDVIGGERPNVFDMVEISTEEFHKKVLWGGGLSFTESILNSTEVRKLLAEDVKFDLIINEQFFQEATNVLAYKYDAPLVLVTTFGNCMRHNILTRNPLQLATVISEFLDVKVPTSFWARLRNLYFTVYEYVYWRYVYLNQQEALVKKYIPDLRQPVPSLYELQKNVSLMLVNGHFSFDIPVAYLPNVVEIGGIHLTKSETMLPDDLQKVLDNAKSGVIYMNFGSNVRSSELPNEKRDAFLNVFRKLNQTILWKWEDDTLVNILPNVIIRKWLPQKEILSHPNIKLFISHGGLIGTQEAVFYRVPILGIPIYADQFNNLLQTEQHGVGKILLYHSINEDTLTNSINTIISNDLYRKNALKLSLRFKDRPMSPLNTAMYWIEYIIRHNGAEHLKNPARKMNWIAYNMLDVYVIILTVFIVIVYLLLKLTKILLCYLIIQKNVKPRKKKLQ